MIDNKVVEEAFEFYNIDKKYKKECYKCIKEISENVNHKNAFDKVHKILYYSDFSAIKELWKVKDINKLFTNGINTFVTNLMIIVGYKFHKDNMKKHDFDENQIRIHKQRVKECFENDLINRGYKAIRISQMLWATYFIRVKIIEVGRLQYGLNGNDIKIHIPGGTKLNYNEVINSLNNSKIYINKYFELDNYKYYCESWLLSPNLKDILDKDSNIMKFQTLFNIKEDKTGIDDILNFVFNVNNITDYNKLEDKTTLQRNLKKYLLQGNDIKIGIGELKDL